VCNPDKPVGRKKIITPPLTKIIAENHKIPVFQPGKSIEIKEQLKKLKPDIAIIAAYAQIIPEEILDIPKFGTFGIHPSLLPYYRGATPIQTAILNGKKETGVTIFKVDKFVDHGPILSQKECDIDKNDTYISLEKKLAELGADLLIEFLENLTFQELEVGLPKIELKSQDESRATYTKKNKTDDGYIPYEDIKHAQSEDKNLASEISKKVRALGHEPGVWTVRDGKRMKLLEVSLIPDGLFHIKKIHIEGKRPQNV